MDVPNDCQDPIIQCTTSFGKERSRFHSSLANFGDLIPSKTVLVCIFLSFFHRSSLILILIKPNARSIPVVNAQRCALLALGRAWTLLESRENSKQGKYLKMLQSPSRPVHAVLGGLWVFAYDDLVYKGNLIGSDGILPSSIGLIS